MNKLLSLVAVLSFAVVANVNAIETRAQRAERIEADARKALGKKATDKELAAKIAELTKAADENLPMLDGKKVVTQGNERKAIDPKTMKPVDTTRSAQDNKVVAWVKEHKAATAAIATGSAVVIGLGVDAAVRGKNSFLGKLFSKKHAVVVAAN